MLQHRNIHICTCEPGRGGETLQALRNSPKTAAGKVRFILATDGETLEAEEMGTGETIAPRYVDFASHFGFFLPLAGGGANERAGLLQSARGDWGGVPRDGCENCGPRSHELPGWADGFPYVNGRFIIRQVRIAVSN